MREYQITLFCKTGVYKPVSCIVKYEELDLTNSTLKKQLIQKGIIKICQKRLWTLQDLKNYGYTKTMIRLYDKIEIEKANQERYKKIKEQHYLDGSWKRPKNYK